MEFKKLSFPQRIDLQPIYKITLLGPPLIYKNNINIPLSRKKSAAVLAYLADTRRTITRTDISTIFWPESSPANALGALRVTLADIKSTLGSDLLTMKNDTIYLSKQSISCDVEMFREGLISSESSISGKKQIEALWNGGFLKGFDLRKCPGFTDWQFLEEQNLLRKYRDLLKEISFELKAENSFEEALIYCRKYLLLDFFDEETHREIMGLYAAIGDTTAALRQYEILADTLNAELDFPPEEQTQVLAEQIRTRNYDRIHKFPLHMLSVKKSMLPRIAVLPFITRNTEKKEYLDLNVIAYEAITDIFTSNPGLEVISRTSTLSYKNSTKNLPRIAAELRVDYIVEGFIEVLHDNILLESRLIDASRDSVITIRREKTEQLPELIVGTGALMANDFINELSLIEGHRLSQNTKYVKDPDRNDPGRPWRLHAKHLLRDYNLNNIDQAMELYSKAVKLNTYDAEAWAGIAFANLIRGASGYFGADIELIYKQAEESVTKALSIKPDQATALWIRGQIAAKRDWDFEIAEQYYKKAINSDPENSEIFAAYSQNLNFQGKFEEALDMAERACQLDPVNNLNFSAKYWALISLKLYRKASEYHESVNKFFPNPAWHYFSRGFIQILLGNYKKAIKIIEPLQDDLIAQNMFTFLGMLAYAYAADGSPGKAENLIEDLRKNSESLVGIYMPVAATYAVMNKPEKAMDCLENAADTKDPGLFFLASTPFYKPLYKTPRFITLLDRVNIKPKE